VVVVVVLLTLHVLVERAVLVLEAQALLVATEVAVAVLAQ
jgi:hypothetical protein